MTAALSLMSASDAEVTGVEVWRGGGGEREKGGRGGGGGGTPDNHNKHGTNKRSETEPMMGSECFVGRMSNVKYTSWKSFISIVVFHMGIVFRLIETSIS